MAVPCVAPWAKQGLYWEKMVAIRRKATINFKVGAVRFELTTFWTRTKRATRLRYAPKNNGSKISSMDTVQNHDLVEALARLARATPDSPRGRDATPR